MPYLLAGIKFPFQNSNAGTPCPALGQDVVRYALIVLIRTRKRSRVMRPNVGTNLQQLLFEDEGPVLQTLITRELASAIATQLPQVVLRNIQIQESSNNVAVNVQYSIQGVQSQTGFISLPKG